MIVFEIRCIRGNEFQVCICRDWFSMWSFAGTDISVTAQGLAEIKSVSFIYFYFTCAFLLF